MAAAKISPDPIEAAASRIGEVAEEIIENLTGQEVKEGLDTPPTHQRPAVTATTSMARTLGTVPPPRPAPGCQK